MRKTIPKAELEATLQGCLKALRSHKGKRISFSKAFDLLFQAATMREVKIVHVR